MHMIRHDNKVSGPHPAAMEVFKSRGDKQSDARGFEDATSVTLVERTIDESSEKFLEQQSFCSG
jgi:hypothetical protein